MLVVSNGVGEDLIATRIVESLPDPDVTVTAYPLVGLGAYPSHIPLLDPRRALPGGGFSLRAGLRGLWADLISGLVGLWLAQRRTLLGQRGRFDLVTAVGDTYCLWMAGLAAPRVAFVSTADSVRISPFGRLPRISLRRHARRIFARDSDTAQALVAQGLPAVAVGNVMMDLVHPVGERFSFPAHIQIVTLLPGSRGDAPENAALLARAARAIAEECDVRFLLALAPTVSADDITRALRAAAGGTTPVGEGIRIGPAEIHLTSAFADAIQRASIVLGLAGTANEQAAGLGRPVVSFPGPGPQYGPAFLHDQHRLLGEALVPTSNWQEAALAAVRLLRSPEERERRGAVGRARMGSAGGAQRIAGALVEMIQKA